MLKIRLAHNGCPGDWLVMTGAASLWHHHNYLRFRLDTCCPEIFANAPWAYGGEPDDRTVTVDYGWARSDCDHRDLRFLPAFYTDLRAKLGLPARLEVWTPQIYFSQAELDLPPQVEGPYCVICSGWKRDYPIKNWGFANWQKVSDWIQSDMKIKVVQVGEHSPPHHVHRPLRGAVDLVGKTNTRQLYLLAYHSLFGLGHESYLHHVYASTFHGPKGKLRTSRPFVCLASGWNPKLWCSYSTEVYLTRQGMLDCCSPGGCNQPNIRACVHPAKVADEEVGLCLQMIKPSEAIGAIVDFQRGGLITLPATEQLARCASEGLPSGEQLARRAIEGPSSAEQSARRVSEGRSSSADERMPLSQATAQCNSAPAAAEGEQTTSITLPLAVAQKYLSAMFVETGTYRGGGVAIALQAGFPQVRSVDVNREFFLAARRRFRDRTVKLYCASSTEFLTHVLKSVNHPVTFWLDAHDMAGNVSPLLDELDVIGKHPIKTHTILIDDRRCWKSQWNIDEHVVIQKLRALNPEYTILFEDSTRARHDVLVAVVARRD